jgi:hypothetical protein
VEAQGDDSARAMASKALDHPNVAYLVEQYFGADPQRQAFTRESALQHAAEKARKATDEKVALDYFRLVIEMEGWRVKPAENTASEQTPDPNATVTI